MRLDALNPVFASKITDDAVACAQSLGYSKQMIAWGFDHMFAHWAPTTWIDFLRGEIPALSPTHAQTLCNADLPDEDRAQIWANTLGKNKRIYQRIVLVPASTVPSAVFQDICQILILPVALTLRPPRAHIDLYVRTLRADRGRVRAALSLSRAMVARITKDVAFGSLPAKQKLYYMALRALPALSFLLP